MLYRITERRLGGIIAENVKMNTGSASLNESANCQGQERDEAESLAESLYYLDDTEVCEMFKQAGNAISLIAEAMKKRGVTSSEILEVVARKAGRKILQNIEKKSSK